MVTPLDRLPIYALSFRTEVCLRRVAEWLEHSDSVPLLRIGERVRFPCSLIVVGLNVKHINQNVQIETSLSVFVIIMTFYEV